METKTRKREQNFQQVSDAAGKRAVEWMRADLGALHHAQECKDDPDTCRYFESSDGKRHLIAKQEDSERFHDEDAARQHIKEAPLSIEVRSDWHSIGETGEPDEYRILLGTGGPASQIVGDLDNSSPSSAHFQYQDWSKPWTTARLSSDDESVVLEWAQTFYFGE